MGFRIFFKRLSKIDSNRVTSIAAIVVSVATLIVLVYQLQLTRKQQYVSVLPYLSISYSRPSLDEYKLYVTNVGIGPAFIENVTFKFPHQDFEGDGYFCFFKYNKKPMEKSQIYSSGFKGGNMLPSENSSVIIGVRDSENDANIVREFFTSDSLTIEVVYSSVYGEKWVLSNKDGVKKLNLN